jgi:beta-glucosidase
MAEATLHFPKDFRWGTATAAHQVEGDNRNNDYWAWEQVEGHIFDNQQSGLACNWWAPGGAEADFDRMVALGQNAHRLSVEWSRIEPAEGRWDDDALGRYREMLRGLRERGVEPMVTLLHFTLPLWLAERGGFESATAIALFERFCTRVVAALGEYCDLWCTINEPMIRVVQGYVQGVHPPGKHNLQLGLTVARNLVKAHGAAYHAIHKLQPGARVGFAHHMRVFDPARSWLPLDRAIAGSQDWLLNEMWLRATVDGWLRPPLGRERISQLAGTLDWVGLNYYTRDLVAFDPRHRATAFGRNYHAADAEISDGGYGELYPEGLFRCLRRLVELKRPMYITETGLPDADDDQRPRFLLTHLREVWRALNFNWPVKGVYHWTLVDNFEWHEGWSLRFGLIALDPQTQERRVRPSGELYAEIAKTNSLSSDMASRYAPEVKSTLFPG